MLKMQTFSTEARENIVSRCQFTLDEIKCNKSEEKVAIKFAFIAFFLCLSLSISIFESEWNGGCLMKLTMLMGWGWDCRGVLR